MSKTNTTGILSQSSWWVLNKSLTIKLGFDASLLLSDLTSKQDYFENRDMLTKDGFFFNIKTNIEEDTSLTAKRQVAAMLVLKKYELVETEKSKSIPPKLFYKVNSHNVNKLIAELHSV